MWQKPSCIPSASFKRVMNEILLKPGLDTVLVVVPFVCLLLVGQFRLDGIIAAPTLKRKAKVPALNFDRDGRPLMTDPDGRPWDAPDRPR